MTIERGIKRILVVLSALTAPAWISVAVLSGGKGLLKLGAVDWFLIVLLSALSCGLLWGAFYILRWIARGFREPKGTN